VYFLLLIVEVARPMTSVSGVIVKKPSEYSAETGRGMTLISLASRETESTIGDKKQLSVQI